MKKIFFAFAILGVVALPSCSDDDDNGNGNGGGSSSDFVGTWKYDSYVVESSVSESGMSISIDGNMIGGDAFVTLTTNPNIAVPTGEIEMEYRMLTIMAGDTLVDQTYTDDISIFEDEAEWEIIGNGRVRFDDGNYELVSNYQFSGNELRLWGTIPMDDDMGGSEADFELILVRQD